MVRELIERYCLRDDLRTSDPYDIWKTSLGFHVKHLFNRNRYVGLLPVAALALFDTFLNNQIRILYSKQEYPIVRAMAALALLNLYEATADRSVLEGALVHLSWLDKHSNQGHSGKCWGIGFRYSVSKEIVYDESMAFSTVTPYPLEAFDRYSKLTGSAEFFEIIRSVYDYVENDILVLEETEDYLVTSYGPIEDRVVINAVSYTMLAYAILIDYRPEGERAHIRNKISKLYRFIEWSQGRDGSWFYAADKNSFVDCFHSCIVIKNILKTHSRVGLKGADVVARKGYCYVKEKFRVSPGKPFKRFTVANKPSLIKYDLYDNAEMLNIAVMVGDVKLAREVREIVGNHFIKGGHIYSKIDLLGIRRDRDMLRWAVLPYLYAESEAIKAYCKET